MQSRRIDKKIIFEIQESDIADEIVHMYNTMQFDLVIMGSRRISSRIWGIASTIIKVATTVKRPLLIVQRQRTYKDEWESDTDLIFKIATFVQNVKKPFQNMMDKCIHIEEM